MKSVNQNQVEEIAAHFPYADRVLQVKPYGNGHINDTFLVTCKVGQTDAGARELYILQRINTDVFPQADELMNNIQLVTEWLGKRIKADGGDVSRQTLTVVKDCDNRPYYFDPDTGYWRTYLYIEDSFTLEQARSVNDFYESAVAFGRFESQLADFPAQKLFTVIPGFHDTAKRYSVFEQAVTKDACGRVNEVRPEIDFVQQNKYIADTYAGKDIPLRVTHNDTKLNNVLFDKRTDKALCVIDLDTVMPGFAMNDFGDSIRFGASTALEDETDLSKVQLDLDLFSWYAKGFLKETKKSLLPQEIELLPDAAIMMTYECGMRFLTDYLQGDTYFHIAYPKHNLDRARNQFKLVADMQNKRSEMQKIIEEQLH